MGRPRRFAISRHDPRYPERLEDLESDAPPVLYGIGDPDLLAMQSLGVIGARRATPYGTTLATSFARWAAERGVAVVSGAARGCDQSAHTGALAVGGPTVAVFGCGADIDYPGDSGALLQRIRTDGCVVSELPWGTRPARWTFVRRNRLIAALSSVLLVVEAGLPSGTFSTAEMADGLGRPVFAVPGSVLAPECRGTNRLVRQGALIASEVSDIAPYLKVVAVGESDELAVRTRDELLRALAANPMRPDDIAVALSLDIVEAAVRLSELETAGRVRRFPDGRYGAVPQS